MKVCKLALAALAATAAPSGVAAASSLQSEAMRLAEEQRFAEALSLLAAEDAERRATYEHRFLTARFLSWNKQYAEAREMLEGLQAEFPDDSDVYVALGNLGFYTGDLIVAEAHFSKALELAPTHGDAASGLERVQAAREQKLKETAYKWRVDAGGSRSTFDVDAVDAWSEQFVNVQRRAGNAAIAAGLAHYQRFGMDDVQVQASVTRKEESGIDWGVTVAATPDADFRPEASIGANVGKTVELNDAITAHLALSYRFDSFQNNFVQTTQPEVTAYFDSGLVLSGRVIITAEEDAKAQVGYMVRGNLPVTDRARISLGYADAPELINGRTIATKSVFGGVSFDVADDLSFQINVTRADRENIHVRNDVSVGFTRKF